jgi:hypothetical protein
MSGLASSKNAILFSQCQSLQNLTLALRVTQDLITLGNNGFSLQLNCYPQTNPQATYLGVPLEWFQYVIAVESDSLQWGIQYWSTVKGSGFNPSPNYVAFGSATSNQVPAGSVLKIALATDTNGNVTSATFGITDSKGKISSYTFTFPSNVLCAIYGFQVNLVGPPSGTHTCMFTAGAGTLTCTVSSGALSVQTTNTCGGPQILTGETSNAEYGDVTPASGSTVSQSLYVTSPFFIQSKLGDLVIDVQEASTKPGTPLDAYTQKTAGPGWNNQLWKFVTSSFEGYYVLQNPASGLVIDVQGDNTKPGTPLDAYTLKMVGSPPLVTNAENQLWSFIPSSVPGYYFIQSKLGDLVIDVQGASTKPGTLLDAYTKKTTSPAWDNQLWTFTDEHGDSATPPPPPPVIPPPK